MKRIAAIVFIGVFVAFSMGSGDSKSLGEWLIKPGGSPPVITHWFASEELSHGDIWKIYLEAHDPDGDMRLFVGTLDQVGYGRYSSQYVRIKKKNREELRGYFSFWSLAGQGLWLSEWTQLRLTVYIRDKGGNSSNKVVFPLVLSRGAKQEPPAPPFDSGKLDKLGVMWFDLVEPALEGGGNPRFPEG